MYNHSPDLRVGVTIPHLNIESSPSQCGKEPNARSCDRPACHMAEMKNGNIVPFFFLSYHM